MSNNSFLKSFTKDNSVGLTHNCNSGSLHHMLTSTTKLVKEKWSSSTGTFSTHSLCLGEFDSLFHKNKYSAISPYNLTISVIAISNTSWSNSSPLGPPQQMETELWTQMQNWSLSVIVLTANKLNNVWEVTFLCFRNLSITCNNNSYMGKEISH